MRLYILHWAKIGLRNQIVNQAIFLHPTHCGREQRSMGRAPLKKRRRSPWCAPNEAEEMCRIISFDFPTVHLAGLPAWFATIPEDPHSGAPPTSRLHVRMPSTVMHCKMFILCTITGCAARELVFLPAQIRIRWVIPPLSCRYTLNTWNGTGSEGSPQQRGYCHKFNHLPPGHRQTSAEWCQKGCKMWAAEPVWMHD